MSSNAQTGSQTIFAIGADTIGEVLDFTQSGRVNKTADVTNLQSSADEFIATLQTPGMYDLTFNRVSSDAGQVALLAAFNSKAHTAFTITLPLATGQTDTGDSYAFYAVVEEFEDLSSLSPTKQITTKAKIKVSGAITYTEGA